MLFELTLGLLLYKWGPWQKRIDKGTILISHMIGDDSKQHFLIFIDVKLIGPGCFNNAVDQSAHLNIVICVDEDDVFSFDRKPADK